MQRMFFLLVFCAFTAVNAQLLPSSKPVQAHMTDSTGKLLLMDFGIKLTGIKDVNTPFSVFSSRPLMIYYFSPFCPHCQRSYGGIQQVAKEYEQKGLTSLAISVKSVGKRDILMFMEERKASIPFFQDTDEDFSKKYGDGYVPRLYLVSPDGKIVRYTALENENLKEIKADIEKLLGLGK
ncbi:MAG: TlpA family protein disulfide reductase [Fibromonadaceae bacterium]|nr:TlpA family protein disulfide reductase [Fibromonadaceae bacterium]